MKAINRFCHGGIRLELWVEKRHPDVWTEWQYSEAVERMDFWDWLYQEHWDVLAEYRAETLKER